VKVKHFEPKLKWPKRKAPALRLAAPGHPFALCVPRALHVRRPRRQRARHL
jgi:hypothetical protein